MNDTISTKVITRFPPSPTGGFHVGSARTALFNYLFAKQHGGTMLLRFEDTDKARSKREYEKDITDSLDWLGIEYEGGIRQSERTSLYSSYIEKMIDGGFAYISDEKAKKTQEGSFEGRETVIRFKNPNTLITFHDLIRGEIEVDTSDLGDFVIAKSFDEPLYHLAVVVDDYDMGITHIIRGDDHISNTPRQILIQRAIGAPTPIYAHIPLILGPDRSKLSKRHGAKGTMEYKKDGIVSEGMFNYLSLLGWNPGDNQEIFSKEELVRIFDLQKVQKSGAIFSMEKLLWINKQHLDKKSGSQFLDLALEYIPNDIKKLPQYNHERVCKALLEIRSRIHALNEVEELAKKGELEYLFEAPGYHVESLLWKDEKDLVETKKHLSFIYSTLSTLNDTRFTKEEIKNLLWEYADKEGRGSVLWPFRYSLSGMDRSPDPFTLGEILGRTETLSRIMIAIEKIDSK